MPENAVLKAMVGKGYRNPTIREMFIFPPQNPDLKPEKLVNYELSYSQHLWNGALAYGANFYYINGDNVISRIEKYINKKDDKKVTKLPSSKNSYPKNKKIRLYKWQ
jgi:outer membrane receptor protein involved in Fe transport